MATTAQSGGINSAFASNKFFTAKDDQINVLGFNNLGQSFPKLTPKGSGLVDVVNTMQWKNVGVDTREVPYVIATERELLYGTWTANLIQLLEQSKNLLSGNVVDSYLQLYNAQKTGFWYNFPFLLKTGDNIRNIQNTWSKAKGIGDLAMGMAGTKGGVADVGAAIAGAAVGTLTPGVGFEETYQFNSTSPQSITVTFPLYNTISLEAAYDHYCFIQLFSFQNLKTRTSLLTFIPPKIYTVDTFSLGGVYMAAAYVSNFKVDSIGTTRRLSEFASFGSRDVLIPEAYKVSITFTDLVSQSSNIFSGTMGGSKIEVTNVDPGVQAGIQQANQGFGDFIRGVIP